MPALIYFNEVDFMLMMQDGAAVTGLAIAAASLVAVEKTGNAIYDPIGSIIVGNLLGMVGDTCMILLLDFIKHLFLYSSNNIMVPAARS